MDVKTLQIYEATGVGGGDEGALLNEFSAALQVAANNGIVVERYDLTQQPEAFESNESVRQLLSEQGNEALPCIAIDRELRFYGALPSTEVLFEALELVNPKIGRICPHAGAADGCRCSDNNCSKNQ